MARDADVLIIGAGPGGCAAALKLNKLGIKPLIVDKATFPRDKICGDAISGKVVEALNRIDRSIIEEFRSEPAQIGSWGVTFVAPNGKSLRIPFKQTYDAKDDPAPGFISKRLDFDNFLVEQVRENGIEISEDCEVTDVEYRDNQWTVLDKSGMQIKSNLLIVANGAQSKLSRSLGNIEKEPEHYCAGIRAYYHNVGDLEKDNFIELHFLKEFLPGYLWIFPLPNGRANVGVGMRTDKLSKRKINLKKKLLELITTHPALKQRFRNAKMEGDIQGFGLPLGSKKRSISGKGFMLVGDAASLIDPFTGEGIGNAMMSGIIAAEVAHDSLSERDPSGKFLQNFDEKVYNKLWSELKLSHRMQQLVNYPWLFNLVVNKANNNETLQETISCMFEDLDMRSKLRKPGFYWKLLFG